MFLGTNLQNFSTSFNSEAVIPKHDGPAEWVSHS